MRAGGGACLGGARVGESRCRSSAAHRGPGIGQLGSTAGGRPACPRGHGGLSRGPPRKHTPSQRAGGIHPVPRVPKSSPGTLLGRGPAGMPAVPSPALPKPDPRPLDRAPRGCVARPLSLARGPPGAQGPPLSRLAEAGGAGRLPGESVAGPLGETMGREPTPGVQHEQAASETEPTDGRSILVC